MSHEIRHFTFDESVDKKAIAAKLDNYVSYEDWQEGASGLPYPIRWKSDICDSYDDAMKYIEEYDASLGGSYNQIAVRYKEADLNVVSKNPAYVKACQRYNAARDRYAVLNDKVHYKDSTSAFVGCKHCGSKIAQPYIKTNFCPVCRADLRPQSLLDRLSKLEESRNKAYADFCVVKKKIAAKEGKIKWLVKIEYHT